MLVAFFRTKDVERDICIRVNELLCAHIHIYTYIHRHIYIYTGIYIYIHIYIMHTKCSPGYVLKGPAGAAEGCRRPQLSSRPSLTASTELRPGVGMGACMCSVYIYICIDMEITYIHMHIHICGLSMYVCMQYMCLWSPCVSLCSACLSNSRPCRHVRNL